MYSSRKKNPTIAKSNANVFIAMLLQSIVIVVASSGAATDHLQIEIAEKDHVIDLFSNRSRQDNAPMRGGGERRVFVFAMNAEEGAAERIGTRIGIEVDTNRPEMEMVVGGRHLPSPDWNGSDVVDVLEVGVVETETMTTVADPDTRQRDTETLVAVHQQTG